MTDPYNNAPQSDPGTTAPMSGPGSTAPMNGGRGVSYASDGQSSGYASYGQVDPVYASAPTPAAVRRTSGLTFLWGFLGALLACIVAFIVLWAMGGIRFGANAVDTGTHETVTTSSLGAEQYNPVVVDDNQTLAEAVSAKCLPSVAAIDVYGNVSNTMNQYGYGYGYGSGSGNSDTLTKTSLGSGVVLSADGYVITNYHVVENGSAYMVTVEGEEYDAQLVGSDPSSDIAVLKLQDASGLTPIEVGDSENLTIGEWVMTLGSPFGLEQSVATGIVSATSRSQIMNNSSSVYGSSTGTPTLYPGLIQTDAAINPGNSGGALVDSNGQLIGINTLITTYSGSYSGVGFAIPSNYAINLAQQIINGEEPTHAQLGVSLSTVNSSTASRYGLATDSGAYVASVTPDSGAAKAGIQEGDIITAFDGKKVTSSSDLMLDVRLKHPGDVVSVTINRNGQTSDLQVTLGSDSDGNTQNQSQSDAQQQQQQQQQDSGSSFLDRLFNYGQ